jgi:hypothetical protein
MTTFTDDQQQLLQKFKNFLVLIMTELPDLGFNDKIKAIVDQPEEKPGLKVAVAVAALQEKISSLWRHSEHSNLLKTTFDVFNHHVSAEDWIETHFTRRKDLATRAKEFIEKSDILGVLLPGSAPEHLEHLVLWVMKHGDPNDVSRFVRYLMYFTQAFKPAL